MPVRTITMVADTRFVEEIDEVVLRYKRAHPDHGYSRSAFMKSAIRRAMADLNAQPEVKGRTRQREGITTGATA